jgi:hypothetical protein
MVQWCDVRETASSTENMRTSAVMASSSAAAALFWSNGLRGCRRLRSHGSSCACDAIASGTFAGSISLMWCRHCSVDRTASASSSSDSLSVTRRAASRSMALLSSSVDTSASDSCNEARALVHNAVGCAMALRRTLRCCLSGTMEQDEASTHIRCWRRIVSYHVGTVASLEHMHVHVRGRASSRSSTESASVSSCSRSTTELTMSMFACCSSSSSSGRHCCDTSCE